MKKISKKIVLIISITTLAIAGTVYVQATSQSQGNLLWNLGRLFKTQTEDKSAESVRARQQIYARGKDISISKKEMDDMTERYQLSGNENPQEAAFQDIVRRKTLVQKAVEEGYTVTEAEVDAIIQELRDAIALADNKEDHEQLVAGFGGEEEYWSAIRDITREGAIATKYFDDVRDAYMLEHPDEIPDMDIWRPVVQPYDSYIQQLEKHLIEEQNVVILEEEVE